ncbi:MAG: PIN domain-containing protein [Candidatus Dormibacteria bacterium]
MSRQQSSSTANAGHREGVAKLALRTWALPAAFSTLPVDITVARAYAPASAALARAGAPVDASDLWIGATAIAHSLSVLALDGDFDRIPGVTRLAIARLDRRLRRPGRTAAINRNGQSEGDEDDC